MIVKESKVNTPHGNNILWRYMNLEKFFDLITSSEIYFTNVSQLTDKYEGTIPKRNYYSLQKKMESEGMNKEDIVFELEKLGQKVDRFRELTLVNCWTLAQNESYALWKIYLDGSKGGIAIKTTASRIVDAFNNGGESNADDIIFSIVEYKDFIEDVNNQLQWITRKSNFYEFENEARLIILHTEDNQPSYNVINGRRYKVNIGRLIDRIYISPFSPGWFRRSLHKTIEKIKPEFLERINFSEILDE
jgi:hypothetical protein